MKEKTEKLDLAYIELQAYAKKVNHYKNMLGNRYIALKKEHTALEKGCVEIDEVNTRYAERNDIMTKMTGLLQDELQRALDKIASMEGELARALNKIASLGAELSRAEVKAF